MKLDEFSNRNLKISVPAPSQRHADVTALYNLKLSYCTGCGNHILSQKTRREPAREEADAWNPNLVKWEMENVY